MAGKRTLGAATALITMSAALGTVGLVLLALREWTTASFIADLIPAAAARASVSEQVAAYGSAARFDLLVAALLVGIALGAVRGGGRAWFLASALVSLILFGVGWYASTSAVPLLRSAMPSWLPAVLLLSSATIGLCGSAIGFVRAPSIPSPRPLVPPVPPSHQAG